MQMRATGFWQTNLVIIVVFLAAFLLIPFAQLDSMKMMPGDVGDARLNNYFLENIYFFIIGKSDSLWQLGVFAPFPYIIGFSDNLFGSAPFYIIPRALFGESDTAFQVWFLFGYVLNYFSAFCALRQLKASHFGALVGALIFAFALPTSSHFLHAQLHFRFALPLAIAYFARFLDEKNFRLFTIATFWLVWQFYCGIYMGFFTLLFLCAMATGYFSFKLFFGGETSKVRVLQFVRAWTTQSAGQRWQFASSLIVSCVLMVLLFYPYLQAAHLYHAVRGWGEIEGMLPRPQSYLLADRSFVWGQLSHMITGISMRHEHQMFPGVVPVILALCGLLSTLKLKNRTTFKVISCAAAILILITLDIGGISLWYFFHFLPLASAIRAMGRIDQLLLFPIGYFAAVFIDDLPKRSSHFFKFFGFIIVVALIGEFSAIEPLVSSKIAWRQRAKFFEAKLPVNLPKDSILFFAQTVGPPYADDLDAMWVALSHNLKTMNGYSGLSPPGYAYEFGTDCQELATRLNSYLKFSSQQNNAEAYQALRSRIVPIDFAGCNSK